VSALAMFSTGRSGGRPYLPTGQNNLRGYLRARDPRQCLTALVALHPVISCVARVLPYSIETANYMEHLRFLMERNKQRAIGILLVLGSILVLMATWDLPQSQPPK